MSETQATDDNSVIGTLPLDAWHRARGARMVEFANYHMPIQYEGIIAEHLWTRENAGLFDVSHMGQLIFSAGDATLLDDSLEALLPANIEGLAEGKQAYSLLLNESGGILDDLMIARTPTGFYMVVNGAVKWDDIGHIREQLPDDITMNHLEDRALLALQGPKAVDALAKLVPGVDKLYFMEAGSFLWGHEPLWISRSGYTGEDGVEISVAAEAAEALAVALCALPEVKPIGLGARDSLRLEAGLPLYGHDLDETIDPIEAGLGFAVPKRRRAEGGFLGAAHVLSRIANGPPRKRVGLRLEGRLPAREATTIHAGAAQVGRVTSGGFSPSLQLPIAMGYVEAEYAAPGTALEIDVRGKRIAATVCTMPFVPHTYVRKGAVR